MRSETKVLTSRQIMEVLRENTQVLKRFRVKKIGLFGSCVRGEQRKKSDIDVLVEFDKSTFDRNLTGYSDNYDGLLEELKQILGGRVDLVTQDMISPFIKPYVEKDIEYLETT